MTDPKTLIIALIVGIFVGTVLIIRTFEFVSRVGFPYNSVLGRQEVIYSRGNSLLNLLAFITCLSIVIVLLLSKDPKDIDLWRRNKQVLEDSQSSHLVVDDQKTLTFLGKDNTVGNPMNIPKLRTFQRLQTANVEKQFYLQVGAFEDYHNALRNTKEWEDNLGISLKIASVEKSKSTTIYRLLVGPFNNRSSAITFKREMSFDAIVRNDIVFQSADRYINASL